MAIISHVKLNGIQNRTTSRVVSISQISPMEFHEAQPAPRIVLYVVLGAMIFSVVFTGGIVALFEYDQHQSDSSSWIPIAI
jgi:hypothetical protein